MSARPAAIPACGPPRSLSPENVTSCAPAAGLLGEADDTEVRLVPAQENGRPLRDRALVVGEPRAVRRPHLDEGRARAREHVRDAEAVADLDELAARDDHLAAPGAGGGGGGGGGRGVVG